MARRRILYYDQAPAVGGSVISLYHLVAGLDTSRYEPIVLLCASNTYADRFRALGVEVRTCGDASVAMTPRSGTLEAARQGSLAGVLRQSALGRKAVRALGFMVKDLPSVRREADELAEIMRQVQPDLVHLNDVVCVNRAGIMAARRCGLAAICHVRAIAWRNAFDRMQSRHLSGLICISKAVRDHQATLGGRTDPNWIVYNGLKLEDFADLDESAKAVRASLGLREGQSLIGCIARLVPWKGVHVFVEAMAEVLGAYPNACALIVGSPEHNTLDYAQGLKDRVVALGFEDRIIMQAYRPDIADLLGALDILVHASVAPEPFGRIVIEGMAAGATVIGTRAGAIPEIIEDGVTGLMVTPGDAHDMAQAIAHALESAHEREQWQTAARKRVADHFSVERYVAGVESVYDQVMER